MNIYITTGRKNLKYAYVAIKSLFQNNQDREIHLYVVSEDLTTEDMHHEEKLAEEYGHQIHILRFDEEKAGKYIDFLNANAYDKERDVRTNIAGEFQKSNLAAALQTAELICGRLDEDKIYEALSQIRISGRMEEIAPGIIVDVSHNIQGMQGFVQTVEANYHGMKKRILFAASHQNEEEYMKNILKTIPEIEAFYTVGIHKRRIDEAEFQDAFRKMIDRNQETTVCFVVGSFYLAGMAKEFINQEEENVRL